MIVPAALLFGGAVAAHAAEGWLTSYDQAAKLSKKTGKPILADFTGSDWCIWCKRLDGEVFDKKEFKTWAASHVILLELDYPQRKVQPAALKAQNKKLLEKYKIQGYPTVLFLNANGKKLGESGYMEGGPSAWTKSANKTLGSKPKPQTAPRASKPAYPAFVTKKELYAKTDLRGKQAPKLEVEQWLTGKAPETKNKVMLVDYWATWCPPCRELIPEMNEYKKTFGDDLVVIGISDEKTDVVKKFMGTTPMHYNVGIDTKKRMSNVLGVQGIPHVMIVTPDGIVRWQGFPGSEEDPLTATKIRQIINAWKAGVR